MKNLVYYGAILLGLTANAQTNIPKENPLSHKFETSRIQTTRHNPLLETSETKRRTDVRNVKGIVKENMLKRGGQDGNGGDSVLDPQTQKRILLDMIEKDELEYFIPNSNLYETSIPLGLKDILLRMRAECDAFHGKSAQCPQEKTNESGRELVSSLADYSFLYVLIRSYGLNLLLTMPSDPFINEKEISGLNSLLSLYVPEPNQVKPLKWAFVDFDLAEIDDEGAIRIDNPDSKKQLAVQKEGLVVINRREFNKLDKTSQAALFVHEAVLRTVILMLAPEVLEEKGTEPIRTFTRRLVKYLMNHKSGKVYPAYGVREAYDALANE